MTIEEMAAITKANIDRTVTVRFRNGESDLALVLTVDDEGFVYDLASLEPQDRKTSFWTAFSEVEEIEVARLRA